MPIFRKKTPKRRTVTKKVSRYTEHKDNLREDFDKRCGYCNDPDFFKNANFEIDHFIPKKFLKEKFPMTEEYKIKEQEYFNLVYSCRLCNNAKGEEWPTKSLEIHHKDNTGFIDPCESEYDKQFERNENGEIISLTKLGDWIHKTLKLWKPEHSIIWHLDELKQSIDEIEKIIIEKNSIEKEKLEKIRNSFSMDFYRYFTQLRGN
jgi:5-methylcytosine-specific restriction endonuclease McrA